jgi:hypothetical protein
MRRRREEEKIPRVDEILRHNKYYDFNDEEK